MASNIRLWIMQFSQRGSQSRIHQILVLEKNASQDGGLFDSDLWNQRGSENGSTLIKANKNEKEMIPRNCGWQKLRNNIKNTLLRRRNKFSKWRFNFFSSHSYDQTVSQLHMQHEILFGQLQAFCRQECVLEYDFCITFFANKQHNYRSWLQITIAKQGIYLAFQGFPGLFSFFMPIVVSTHALYPRGTRP